jgi:hypothetical protein
MVIANFDIHLAIHAEIKESHYVTVATRILLDNTINQVLKLVTSESTTLSNENHPPSRQLGETIRNSKLKLDFASILQMNKEHNR